MEHRFSLSEIVTAVIHGLAQRILDLIPLVEPWYEPDWPPFWWTFFGYVSDWIDHRNNRGIPDTFFIETYIRLAWRAFGYWVEEIGDWALDTARIYIRSWTGYIRGGWATFADWIDWIGVRLGPGMVYWGQHVIDALEKLYNWLPPEIRLGLQSWGSWIENILRQARDWVTATYSLIISLGASAFAWTVNVGNRINDWWTAARGTLDDFRQNPTGYILSHLGSTWDRLVWFVVNALDFYAGLWGQHAQDLAGFLADPAGWIYSRLEAYLERIW